MTLVLVCLFFAAASILRNPLTTWTAELGFLLLGTRDVPASALSRASAAAPPIFAGPAVQSTVTHGAVDVDSSAGSDPGEAGAELESSRISNGFTISAGLSICGVSWTKLPQKV